jgi:hypothetical protein
LPLAASLANRDRPLCRTCQRYKSFCLIWLGALGWFGKNDGGADSLFVRFWHKMEHWEAFFVPF